MTVADVMALPVMKGTRIVAGSQGLSRRVTAISVIAGTQMADWVKSGSIAISTGHPFTDPAVNPSQLVEDLADCGVSCLAMRLGTYLSTVPNSMIERANSRGIPIIQLSDRHAFDEIIVDVLRKLESFDFPEQEFIQGTRSRFVERYITHGSLHDALVDLGDLINGTIAVHNEFGDVILTSGAERDTVALDAKAASFPFGHVIMGDDQHVLVIRVGTESTPLGWVTCSAIDDEFGASSVLIMESIIDLLTLSIRQFRMVGELARPYINELLADLVSDDSIRVERGLARVRAGGFPFAGDYEVGVVNVIAGSADSQHDSAERLRQRIQAVALQGNDNRDEFKSLLAGRVGDDIVVFARSGTIERAVDVLLKRAESASSLKRSLQSTSRISIGFAGPISSLNEIRRGFLQAKIAALSAKEGGERSMRRFEELGLVGLLIAGGDRCRLVEICFGVLSPLEVLPVRERVTYFRTLKVLIECNCNFAEAARRLFCHYNTIRFRVARLENLVGPFTTDPQVRTNFALCFQILGLIESADEVIERLSGLPETSESSTS